MNPSEIKRKRTETALREVLPEALGRLDDPAINALCVTEVVCSRGRYDAKVYLDPTGLQEDEKGEILKKLRKVSAFLKTYVRESEGWYRAPNFTFDFDDQMERINRMDELFKIVEGKS